MATQTAKIAKASIKNLNVSPRKARLVTDLIKGSSVNEALARLQMTSKRSSDPIAKLVKSAVANARERGLDANRLVIDDITVDKGRVLKRGLSRGRGRVTLVEKKQSHINLRLKESSEAPAGRFVIHEKPKTIKQERAPREDKPKFDQEKEDTSKKGKRPGFVKRFFRRKSV